MTKITKDLANKILVERGYFYGLDHILANYQLPADKALAIRRGLYKYLNLKIQEAKREVVHLQTVLNQMEGECRRGEQSMGRESSFQESALLRKHALTLEGWTISLLESTVTLESAILTPETGGNTINKLKSAFAELWATRVQDGYKMMSNHPELFETGWTYHPGGVRSRSS